MGKLVVILVVMAGIVPTYSCFPGGSSGEGNFISEPMFIDVAGVVIVLVFAIIWGGKQKFILTGIPNKDKVIILCNLLANRLYRPRNTRHIRMNRVRGFILLIFIVTVYVNGRYITEESSRKNSPVDDLELHS